MGLDFFRVDRGLQLDNGGALLFGAGAPGITGDSTIVVVGSVYLDSISGAVYTKISAGAGQAAWQKMASEEYVRNAIVNMISWRAPAVVNDIVSTAVPVGTPGLNITVDGVSIDDGQRVLFSVVNTGGGPNVYTYDKTSGLFVEDTNTETSGDALYITDGTSAGKTVAFNGSIWVLVGQSALDELGFVRTFIGKTSQGSELPTYSSANFVVQNANLRTAISQIDTALGANVSVGNFVLPSAKMNANILALDTALGPNVISGTYIVSSNKANTNIQALDTALGASTKQTSVLNVVAKQPIDTSPGGIKAVKWLVRVELAADLTRAYATEVFAITDGTSVDFTKYGTLSFGTAIPGLDIDVDLSGGNLRLSVGADLAVNVIARRSSVMS